MREITLDDINSAIRGLGLNGMCPSKLQELIEQHGKSDAFASRVITHAARHVSGIKRFNGHA